MIYDFYLVSSSLALLPTLKYYRLRSFSTIIFELPLDPFKVQFLVIINDVFVGPNIFDILTCAKYLLRESTTRDGASTRVTWGPWIQSRYHYTPRCIHRARTMTHGSIWWDLNTRPSIYNHFNFTTCFAPPRAVYICLALLLLINLD